MKYLLITAIVIAVILKIAWFFICAFGHKLGLLKLMALERLFAGKISNQEIEQYKRDHK